MDPASNPLLELPTEAPLMPISIRPGPPIGPPMSDSTVIYSGERLMELGKAQPHLLRALTAQQADREARGHACNQAWAARLATDPPPTPAEVATQTALVEALQAEQTDLNRSFALIVVRYLVWEVQNPRADLAAHTLDPASWDTIPTALLRWMIERGARRAREEIDGPLS